MEPQHRPLLEVSKQLAWTFLRLQRLLDRLLAGSDASVAKIRLLAYVADEPRRSTDIATFFGHSPRTVTQAIDALEAIGHLRRCPMTGDRRAKLIEITEEGRALLQRAQPVYVQILDETVGRLPPEELAAMDAALVKLSAFIEAAEQRADQSESD
ncbi:MarR family winged helix-turn-helix transcriptional regulator [Altererythrobacter lauratis]|uniref:MarR family winged helix-turn-helix transcriptional regulator n=1 Tax=Alteraurantiacibacter lauratis TaxID=2054627 RepID=A0ABV7EET6_9SPHN